MSKKIRIGDLARGETVGKIQIEGEVIWVARAFICIMDIFGNEGWVKNGDATLIDLEDAKYDIVIYDEKPKGSLESRYKKYKEEIDNG